MYRRAQMKMPDLKISKALERAFFSKRPIIVLYGGRGSGKSLGVGDIMTYRMDTEAADIYCLREFQGSIEDSVHRVFQGSVKHRLKLPDYTVQKNTVMAPNGAKTTYVGANRNPDSMQSAQGYKYSWFEEAHRASEDSLDKLLPTILRNPGAQCWFTANPQSSADPFSQRFIIPYQSELEAKGFYEDDIHLIMRVNWRDNPWWNEEQEKLRRWDFEHLSRSKYDWIWEGHFNDGVEDALIMPEWFDACIDACSRLGIEPRGARVTAYDPADTGDDMNAVASRQGIHYDLITEIDKEDGNQACDEVCRIARQKITDLFVWDGDGMGALLRKQIAENFQGVKIETRMYRGSGSVDGENDPNDGVYGEDSKTNGELFANKRAQYYVSLATRMNNTYRAVVMGEYIAPDDLISISGDIPMLQKIRAEVCAIPRKRSFSGKIALMSKEEMKKKYKRMSPNMADCLAMGEERPNTKAGPVKIEFETWA